MMSVLRATGLRGVLLLLAAGASWTLAFEPLSWPFVQWFSLLFALRAMQGLPVRQAAALGWVYGFGMFSVGVCWLYISLNGFGGVPAPVAVFAVAALAAYMALYPALAIALTAGFRQWGKRRLSRRASGALAPLAFASAWALSEWLRATVFTGFPWLSTGEAWIDTPLAGLYPLVGSYGVAFLVAWSAASLVLAWPAVRSVPDSETVNQGGNGFRRLTAIAPLGLSLLSGWLLLGADWNVREQATVRVHLVQPNVSQTIKFDPDHITRNFLDTILLGRRAAEPSKPGDWLMFPETALPVLWQEAPQSWRNAFAGLAWEYQVPVIMGAALHDGGEVYTNSVIALTPESPNAPDVPALRYDKRHLVPFGEFIPPGFRWFVDLMNMPLGDFTRGRGVPQSFRIGDLHLLPNVCYEDVFGHELAGLVREASDEPHVLFNVSNLAWFGGSWALEQHAQMSRVRSAELRKPMVRSTNTGVSGVIDARGQWVMRLPDNERLAGSADVTGTRGLTPYARFGLLLPLAMAAGLILFALLAACLATFAVPRPRNVQ